MNPSHADLLNALRRVHTKLSKVSALLVECGDAINLRSKPEPIDAALAGRTAFPGLHVLADEGKRPPGGRECAVRTG